MSEDILVPGIVFGTALGIVWLALYFAARRARDVQETIRRAMDGGQQLTPELVRALGAPRRQVGGDLRWGIVWFAVGLGLVGFGGGFYFIAEEAFYTFLAIGAVPASIGVALILVHVLISGKSN